MPLIIDLIKVIAPLTLTFQVLFSLFILFHFLYLLHLVIHKID